MAGIGFELKKIFKKNSILSKLRGATYAGVITIGPLIMIIVTLFLIYYFLGYNNILFASRDLLASTLLYIFIFSLCTTSIFNAVISRYIADKIFERKEEDVLPSFYSMLFVNVLVSSVLGICFCIWGVVIGKIDIVYMFISYCAYIALLLVFFCMTYITALKEYLKIFFAFVLGLSVTLITGILAVKLFGVDIIYAIIFAFALGFTIIAFCLYGLIRSYFRVNSKNYKEVFSYMRRYIKLIFTNAFYTLGLYVHNFIFWTTDLRIVVANTFVSAPIYDLATCIAMFINISTMVIFIVEVETKFHDKYQKYCTTVLGGTGADIQLAKKEMFNTIKSEILFIFQFQMIFTISLYLVALVILPLLGIGNLVISITSTLAIAYMLIFIMYNLIIFIFYFNVYNKALMTSIIFFTVTFIGTLISKNLTPGLYGLGVFLGAFCSFTYAYYAIRNIAKNLDKYIFCSGVIAPVVIDEKHVTKVYNIKTNITKDAEI